MEALQNHEMPELASCLEVLTNQLACMAKDFSNLHTSLVTFAGVLKKENLLRPAKPSRTLKPTIANAPTAPASPKTKPSTPKEDDASVRGLNGLRPSLLDAPTAPGSPKTKPSTPTRPSPVMFNCEGGEGVYDGFTLHSKDNNDDLSAPPGTPTNRFCYTSKNSPGKARYMKFSYDDEKKGSEDFKYCREDGKGERADSPSVKYPESSDNSDEGNAVSLVKKKISVPNKVIKEEEKFEVQAPPARKNQKRVSSQVLVHKIEGDDEGDDLFETTVKNQRRTSCSVEKISSGRKNYRSKSSPIHAAKLVSQQPESPELNSSSSIYLNSKNRVLFNVGGKYFDTSLSTIMKFDNILASMVSGKFGNQREADGSIFIDRDWEYFRHCINYLRDGDSYLTSLRFISRGERVQLISEAKFYGLKPLYKWLEALEQSRRVSEMTKDTTFKRYRYEMMNVGLFKDKMNEWASCWDFEFMILEPSQGRRAQPRFHLILSQPVSRQELDLIERLTARG